MERSSYSERLNRVLRHIENNLDTSLDLNELAEVACFSPYHFHRIFTAVQGETVAAYVRRLLLQRAEEQLSHTKESITQIALGAGYNSIDAFTRAFRAHFGLSPSKYRISGGASARAQSQSPDDHLFYHLIPNLPPLEVQVRKFPPVLVAAIRYTGKYDNCGLAWERLLNALSSQALLPKNFTGYSAGHDNPDVSPKEKCRLEVCLPLPKEMSGENTSVQMLLRDKNIYLRKVGGIFDYAVITVRGAYSLLHPAYRSFYGEWLPQSGREPANDPGFEAYYNSPQTTAPNCLLTEIFVPLRPI